MKRKNFYMKKRLTLILLMITIFLVAFTSETTISTFAGKGELKYLDGSAMEANFRFPYGICKYTDGSFLVADTYNNRIRRINDGQVTTIAGNAYSIDDYGFPSGGLEDSVTGEQLLNRPRYIKSDEKGNVFVSDTGNNMIKIIVKSAVEDVLAQKDSKNAFKAKILIFAGSGNEGYKDGDWATAQFNTPSGIAIDKEGNVFVADTLNNLIREVNIYGQVVTFAGGNTKGGYKNGDLKDALFNEPTDIEFGPDGALYVLDTGNNLIRKIKDGQVTDFAGMAVNYNEETGYYEGGFSNGVKEYSRLDFPKGMDISSDGTIFISDTLNHSIRAIKPDGTLVTIAGEGIPGREDGVLSRARFNNPMDLVYANGSLYIADTNNNCIRIITMDTKNLPALPDRTQLVEGIDFGDELSVIQVFIDKKKLTDLDVNPEKKNNQVYLPMTKVLTSLGYTVKWDSKNKLIKVLKKGELIRRYYLKSNTNIISKDGRNLIESSYFSKEFKLIVKWVPEKNSAIIITSKKN